MTPRYRNDDSPNLWVLGSLAVLVILFSAMVAQAQSVPGNATVRIRQQSCTRGSCTWGHWSGTLVGGLADNRVAVLTCAHGINGPERPLIELLPNEWTEGDVIALDRDADLSLIAIRSTSRVNVIPVAKIATGGQLRVAGFPEGGFYRSRVAQQVGTLGPLAALNTEFIVGESGGTVAASSPDGEVLVGVIHGTDITFPGERQLPRGLQRQRHGYVIPWPTVHKFVLASLGEIPRTEQDNPAPFKRSNPAPEADATTDVDLGDPTPPKESPVVVIRPPVVVVPSPPESSKTGENPQETPVVPLPPLPPQPTEIDWSLARIVVVVPRQEGLNAFDGLVRWFQTQTTAEVGAAAALRNAVNHITDGKAELRFVFQRSQPDEYDRIVSESGVKPNKFASLVVLVKRQGGGLLDPLKTLAVRAAEWVKDRKLSDDLPCELILERTNPKAFESVNAAVDAAIPAGGQPVGPTETVLGVVYAALRAIRAWFGKGESS